MLINCNFAWTCRCHAYPDWSKTTSIPPKSRLSVRLLGKIDALAQKKKCSRLVVHLDAAVADAARRKRRQRRRRAGMLVVCALGKVTSMKEK